MSSNASALQDINFNKVAYIVKASAVEYMYLWKDWHKIVSSWTFDGISYNEKVGEFAEQDLMLNIRFVKIENQTVVFYYPTSLVIHWTIIIDWWKKHHPRVRHGDAENFHNCILDLRE